MTSFFKEEARGSWKFIHFHNKQEKRVRIVGKKHYNIILLAILIVVSACEYKLKPNDEEGHTIEVRRYDRLESRYLTTGDYSALQQMNTDYPIETRTLIERMLQLGPVNDPNISKKFLMFYQDSTLQNLISDAEAEYANMDDINEQLENAFQNLEKWIKDIHRPQFYAQIGALDQSIIVGENSVGISLDKYMGKDYPLYKKYYSQQQRESMRRDQIVPDCLMFYLMSIYPMDNFDTRTQLERDLHVAKIMWVVNKAMEKQAFNTQFYWTVDKYVNLRKGMGVKELLEEKNYSQLIKLHKELNP